MASAGNPALRESLLCVIAAVGGALSSPRRAGADADLHRALTLILLVGRLDDAHPGVRCAAAELLLGAPAAWAGHAVAFPDRKVLSNATMGNLPVGC